MPDDDWDERRYYGSVRRVLAIACFAIMALVIERGTEPDAELDLGVLTLPATIQLVLLGVEVHDVLRRG